MVDATNLSKVSKLSTRLILRFATADDVPELVSHRRRMFEDMTAAGGEEYTAAGLDSMDTAYAAQLRAEMPLGATRAWVIEDGGKIVASGAIRFADWLPRPDGKKRGMVYVHSVYTVPAYRRRGLARRILQAMIEDCRAQGWPRITLHASEAGLPLYESLDFVPTNEMRLVLE